MRYLIVAMLALTGCSTYSVKPANEFYMGCMNGAIARHVLGGYKVENENMKVFNAVCKALEKQYLDRLRGKFHPARPEREGPRGRTDRI